MVTYTVIVSAANPDHLLLPNMTAELRIVVGDTGPTLKIPNQALRFQPDVADETAEPSVQDASESSPGTSATVWVVGNDDHPQSVSVQVGLSDDNNTQLLRGPLTEAQPLIVGVSNSQAHSRFLGIRMGF